MNDSAGRLHRAMRPSVRFGLAALGLILLVGLGVAGWLEPDARGFGTHQQLGLPPCTFRTLFGVRCPSCGMTTAWAHTVRGQIGAAVRANAGGTVLALIVVFVAPWLLIAALRGRQPAWPSGEVWLVAVAGIVVLITLIDWATRLLWR